MNIYGVVGNATAVLASSTVPSSDLGLTLLDVDFFFMDTKKLFTANVSLDYRVNCSTPIQVIMDERLLNSFTRPSNRLTNALTI